MQNYSIPLRAFLILLIVGTAGCTTTTDVTRQSRYQIGWRPGHIYSLEAPNDLLHLSGTDEYYFAYWRRPGTQPVGTVMGGVDNHDEVVVWNAPTGTRVRVEKLLRTQGPLLITCTVAIGRLEDGPLKGTPVELWTSSERIDMDNKEKIDSPGLFYELPESSPH